MLLLLLSFRSYFILLFFLTSRISSSFLLKLEICFNEPFVGASRTRLLEPNFLSIPTRFLRLFVSSVEVSLNSLSQCQPSNAIRKLCGDKKAADPRPAAVEFSQLHLIQTRTNNAIADAMVTVGDSALQ